MEDTTWLDDTWFTIEHITIPFMIPTLMPVVVPGIFPVFMPMLVPMVVPVKVPIVIPDLGGTPAHAGGTSWAPVPIEVVPDQRTEEPPAPTVPPVPSDIPVEEGEALDQPAEGQGAQTEPTVSLAAADLAPAAAQDAPDFPVKIAKINKVSEIVTLENVSGEPVDLTGWKMVSVLGEQVQRGIDGMLAPGQKRYFPNLGKKIWRDDQRDDGALYNPDGHLVSYWRDEA
jgi:hypothetical protein